MPGFQNGVIAETGKLVRDSDSPTGGGGSNQTGRTGIWMECDDGTDSFGMYNYAGDPNSNLHANIGSYCLDTSSGDMWTKTTDNSTTGWVRLLNASDPDTSSLSTFSFYDDFLYASNDAAGPVQYATTSYHWRYAGSATALTDVVETGHPGVWKIGAGAGIAPIYSGRGIALGDGILDFECIVKNEDITSNRYARFGLCAPGQYDAATVTEGIFFEVDTGSDTDWICRCNSSSTSSNIDTGEAVATTWRTFKFTVNAGATSVEFFIDGSSQGSITTNIPTGTGGLRPFFSNGINGNESYLYVDAVLINYAVNR